ncbi:hypothetical protein RND81_01G139100 [Saponaria officinalis]|uniref:Uncharacterized protein n=1 Tax=Saponaria officinalis TaxID=3572 RepID=A0AAW1NE04_SAPOF
MWVATTPLSCSCNLIFKHSFRFRFRVQCSDPQSSNPRGFGSQDDSNVKKRKEQKGMLLQQSNPSNKGSSTMPGQAPGVSSRLDRTYIQNPSDLQFEKKLQAVKRSAVEKKKSKEEKEVGPIDYDAPMESKPTIGLGTKIGVGIAVMVFGLVFALGDFLPSGSISSNEDSGTVSRKLSKEEIAVLQSRLQQYLSTLSSSPKDTVALEGAAVTLAELGDYAKAATYLKDLTRLSLQISEITFSNHILRKYKNYEERPSDPEVFRLLGEVKYELKDYEASISAYKSSDKASKNVDFEVLRGLTNALLAAKKPDEAVRMLLESRERVNNERLSDSTANGDQTVDPVQVELLLGKAYSDWGHISDAVSVYDQLISTHPNDFRAYLAKGIILKQNGNVGDAERMFIQARFFAPEKAKLLVDRYSKT